MTFQPTTYAEAKQIALNFAQAMQARNCEHVHVAERDNHFEVEAFDERGSVVKFFYWGDE